MFNLDVTSFQDFLSIAANKCLWTVSVVKEHGHLIYLQFLSRALFLLWALDFHLPLEKLGFGIESSCWPSKVGTTKPTAIHSSPEFLCGVREGWRRSRDVPTATVAAGLAWEMLRFWSWDYLAGEKKHNGSGRVTLSPGKSWPNRCWLWILFTRRK